MIGTGDVRYARRFVRDQELPFPVLADDDAEAAKAVSARSVGFLQLFHPASYPGSWKAWRDGFRLGVPGSRVNQLGATFVLGPGAAVRYAHLDTHTADHAPIGDVLVALKETS